MQLPQSGGLLEDEKEQRELASQPVNGYVDVSEWEIHLCYFKSLYLGDYL